MKYNFDEIIDRTNTYAVKIDRLPEGSLPDALSVWIADMDFACAPPILEALHRRIDRGIFGYTLYDNKDLKNAVTGWFQRRYGWAVDSKDIFFSPGVVPAIAFLLNILSEEGDGIIIQRPVYYPFTKKINATGRTICNSPLLYQEGKYTMDYADLEEKFSDPTVKGMVFCSPHNPVGRVWSEDELRQLVDIAKKYNKWIISDEIHMDLTRIGVAPIPLAKIAPDYTDSIITCTAPSKTFNLAGMQLSNIVITRPDWQEKWTKLVSDEFSLGSVNPLSVAAAISAYTQCDEWLDSLRDYLDGNIGFVQDFMNEKLPKAKVVVAEGTYLMWIDLNDYESDPKKLELLMQNTAKIAFDEGYIFGEEGNGFERINIAMPRSQVAECMERIKAAIDTL